MGLLDMIGSALGQTNADGQPHQNLLTAVMEFVNNQPGGINGLVQKFHEHGLGDIVQSWIGAGPNQSVSPETLQNVVGSDALSQLASKLGVPPEQASALLAQVLPHVLNHATPNGETPPSGQFDVASVLSSIQGAGGIGSLIEGFLGNRQG
ncbi:MAG TPA: YidB family protein [Trinickia sp.]|uniref:YidB family protein n=1 Tax=Trinickia sp. TaxID=2571163 RepID=UPI002B50EED0|nr:YidB family protein [Trinickia sp.]HVW48967.1 YidB family protein [Trinickia sp.]